MVRFILERLAWTVPVLLGVSLIVFLVLALAPGVLSAIQRGSLLDNLFMLVALFGVSMPIFWLGLMLMLFFAVELRWLPTTGIGGPEYLVLPAVTLSGGSLAIIARMTRSSMLEVFGEDHVRTARAKGLQERTVVLGHVLRNALIPTVTAIGLQFGYLLAGTVLTETVFARPGLGRMLVDAINLRDVGLAQGGIMMLAASFVLVNLAVDVLYVYLDPRIRYD